MRFIPIPQDYGSDELYGRFDHDFDDTLISDACKKGNRFAVYSRSLIRAQAVLDSRLFFTDFSVFAKINGEGISYAKMRDEFHRTTIGQLNQDLYYAGLFRKSYMFGESNLELPLEEITQNTLREAAHDTDGQYLVNANFSLVAHCLKLQLLGPTTLSPQIIGENIGISRKSSANLTLIVTPRPH